MIVTIDGPAGSGKSTVARGLAERLYIEYLDTGAMYRAVALALQRAKINTADEDRVISLLSTLRIDMAPGKVSLGSEDVTELIRSPEITSGSSKVAVIPAVRAYLVDQQQRIAKGRSIVCEGRDQGTVVFPDAPFKFFLTANLEARAKRRFLQLQKRGETSTFEEVLKDIRERDERDSRRLIAPLEPATGAIRIDTSDLTVEQVLDRMEQEIKPCPPG